MPKTEEECMVLQYKYPNYISLGLNLYIKDFENGMEIKHEDELGI